MLPRLHGPATASRPAAARLDARTSSAARTAVVPAGDRVLAAGIERLEQDFANRLRRDPPAFRTAVELALGAAADRPSVDALIDAVLADRVPMPATVRVVETGALGEGVRGAYSKEDGGTLYLDERLLDDPDTLDAVFTEEMGHHIDALIGGADAVGDEGAIFSHVWLGGQAAIAPSLFQSLRAETDAGTFRIDGRERAVEHSRGDFAPGYGDGLIGNGPLGAVVTSSLAADAILGTLIDTEPKLTIGSIDLHVPAGAGAGNRHFLCVTGTGTDVLFIGEKAHLVVNGAVVRRVGEGKEIELSEPGTLGSGLRLVEDGGAYRLTGIAMGVLEEQSAVFTPGDGLLETRRPHMFGSGFDVQIHDVNGGARLEDDDVRTARGTYVAAVEALAPDASPSLAKAIVDDLVALDRIVDARAAGTPPGESLSVAMNRLNRRVIQAGMEPLLPIGDSGNILMTYTIETLPPELRHKSPMQADSNRNDFTSWRYRAPLEFLPAALLERLGSGMEFRLLNRASTVDLTQVDRFPGRSIEHGAGVDRLIELSDPALRVDTLPPGMPTLGDSLQDLAARAPTADTETDFKNLALVNLDVAGHLLYGAPDVVSNRDMLGLFRWVHADDIRQLGWRESETVRPREDDSAYTRDLGPLGGMTRQQFAFATAWLNSTREQRLEYLGLDETRWAPAERFLGDAVMSITRAGIEDKNKFGVDDLVLTAIALGFAYITGGAATSWLGGMMSAGTVTVAAGVTVAVPLTTAQLALAAAGGAAVSAFTSTLILTRGDLDAAIEAGAIGALSGGLSEYVATLSGASRVVADAIIRGAEAELSGEDFADGVLAALGDSIGAGTKAYLRANMGEFVAGFVGQVTASAIANRGDIDLVSEDALSFISEFASGQIRTWFTGTVGEEYRFLSNATEALLTTYIESGGDLNAVKRLLSQPGFVQGLAGDLGADVTAMLGGEENFKALLIGGMTRLIAQGAFDPATLEQSLQAFALSLAGNVAGQHVGAGINSRLGQEDTLLGTVLGRFTDIMVAANGDPAAIAVGIYGHFMNGLAELGAGALPDNLGGADGFLADLIRQFGDSYESSGGNLDVVARDLVRLAAEAGVDEAVAVLRNDDDWATTDEGNGGGGTLDAAGPAELRAVLRETLDAGGRPTAGVDGLSNGSSVIAGARFDGPGSGTEVRAVETQLVRLGYDAASGQGAPDTVYDGKSAGAVAAFAQDQLAHLDTLTRAYAAHSPGSRQADTLARAHAGLAAEVTGGRLGAWTAALLADPLTTATVTTLSSTLERIDPFAAPTDGPVGPLREGMQGERVEALQRRLLAHGLSPGEIDGTFGPQTALMLDRFQSAATDRLDSALESTGLDIHERQALEDRRAGLIREDQANEAGVVTLALLDEAPANDETISAGGRAFVFEGALDGEAADNDPVKVRRLQQALADLGFDPGPVDGLFGDRTEQALFDFQESQHEQLTTVLDATRDAPAWRRERIEVWRTDLLVDMNGRRLDETSGRLLEKPLTVADTDRLIAAMNAPPKNAEALYLLTSLDGQTPASGLIDASDTDRGPLAGLSGADQLREVMRWADDVAEDRSEAREVFDLLEDRHWESLGAGLERITPAEITLFVDALAPMMTTRELGLVFARTSDATRAKLVHAVRTRGDEALQRKFAGLVQRELLESDTRVGEGLTGPERDAMLDLLQLALDLAGVVDPSPLSDGLNGIVSLLRRDWVGAGISALSILPAIGDMAKIGKLGQWAQTVHQVLSLAGSNSELFALARPVLREIGRLIEAIPAGTIRRQAGGKLEDLAEAIAESLDPEGNEFDWIKDDEGRTVQVTGTIRETFRGARSPEESAMTLTIGRQGVAGDVGGHIIGHQFLGGDSGPYNVVAMNGRPDPVSGASNLNQGPYLSLEREIATWVSLGMEVEVDVKLDWSAPNRPDHIRFDFTIVDPTTGRMVEERTGDFDNAPGQAFTPLTRSEMQTFISESRS